MEIERKFLLKEMPGDLNKYEKKVIEQGYLCKKPTVRIRKSNEEYILTYKSKQGVLDDANRTAKVLNEIEVPLGKEGYEHLKKKVDHNIIVKIRYIVPLENGLKAELDIFEGKLSGLKVVEVEFPDEETANAFVPPAWFGKDVSLDSRYTNGSLAAVEKIDWEL